MSRTKRPNPPTRLEVSLPRDLRDRLDLFLTSPLEGRIPFAAYNRFFIARINEFFEGRSLDLAPYLGTPPNTFLVRGEEIVVAMLERHLKGEPL